jgi:hypothetical protein
MTSVLFQFDCLNNYVNLNTLCDDVHLKSGRYVDEWFNVPHTSHERSDESEDEVAVLGMPCVDGEDHESELNSQINSSSMTTVGKAAGKRGRNEEAEEKALLKGDHASKTEKGAGDHVKRARLQELSSKSSASRIAVSSKSSRTDANVHSKLASIQPQVPTQEACARDAIQARNKLAAKKKRQKEDEKLAKEKAQLKRRTQRAQNAKTSSVVRHSVKDVRLWEKQHGKLYSMLSNEERVHADAEISEFLKK